METDMMPGFKQSQTMAATLSSRAVPTWLPAPPVTRTLPVATPSGGVRKAVRSIWIAPERETLGEKLMLTVLVFAAIAGVGYAFAGLLDLVQNWGAFNGWVGQIIK